MLCYEELFTRSQCSNCSVEIFGLGIECAECSGGNFRLCAECCSDGAEIGEHKKEHRYRYFNSGSLALFPGSKGEISSSSTKENNGGGGGTNPRWSAREEIRLMDAIEQFGFGNWQDISKHIESRGPTDAKEEFVQRYVFGNIGKVSWAERNSSPSGMVDYEFKRNLDVFPQAIDHTVPEDDGPLSPSLTQRLPPLNISSDEMLQLGYMPFRDDYEKEYDNESEQLVAPLNFTPEDDELELGMKLGLVDIYSTRLRERARRKRVIRDYQLVCKFFKKDRSKALGNGGGGCEDNGNGKETDRKFQNIERLFQDKFKNFAQFYNCREFENFMGNLVKESDLKHRIQELLKYRAAGITKAEECIEFERSRSSPILRKRSATAAGLGSVEEEDGDEGRSHKRAMIASPALIQQLLQNPIDPVSVLGNEGSVDEGFVVLNPILLPSSRDDFNSKNLESNESVKLALLPHQLEGAADRRVVSLPGTQLEEDLSPLSEKPKVLEGRYTADFIPSADLLTKDELNLCLKLNLLPPQFITIKLASVLGRLETSNSSGEVKTNDENSLFRPADITTLEWDQLMSFLESRSKSQFEFRTKKL